VKRYFASLSKWETAGDLDDSLFGLDFGSINLLTVPPDNNSYTSANGRFNFQIIKLILVPEAYTALFLGIGVRIL